MPLPVSAFLSLPETFRFVADRTGETEDRARGPVIDAALTGTITATGCPHLSVHPNLARYFAAPPGNRQTVPASMWGGTIDVEQSRVGRYSQVRFARAEIERWLSTAAQHLEGKAVPAATVSPNESAITDAKAADDDGTASTVSLAELKKVIEQHGNAAESRLIECAKEAFPQKRTPRQLLRRAREELFGKPSRGAPKKTPQ